MADDQQSAQLGLSESRAGMPSSSFDSASGVSQLNSTAALNDEEDLGAPKGARLTSFCWKFAAAQVAAFEDTASDFFAKG